VLATSQGARSSPAELHDDLGTAQEPELVAGDLLDLGGVALQLTHLGSKAPDLITEPRYFDVHATFLFRQGPHAGRSRRRENHHRDGDRRNDQDGYRKEAFDDRRESWHRPSPLHGSFSADQKLAKNAKPLKY
jgi:hypothetical protein